MTKKEIVREDAKHLLKLIKKTINEDSYMPGRGNGSPGFMQNLRNVGNFLTGKQTSNRFINTAGKVADFTPLGVPRALGRTFRGEQGLMQTGVDVAKSMAGPLVKAGITAYRGLRNLEQTTGNKALPPPSGGTPAALPKPETPGVPAITQSRGGNLTPAGAPKPPSASTPSSLPSKPNLNSRPFEVGLAAAGGGAANLGTNLGSNMTQANQKLNPPSPVGPPPPPTGSSTGPNVSRTPPSANPSMRTQQQTQPIHSFGFHGAPIGTAQKGLNAGQTTNRAIGAVFEEHKEFSRMLNKIMDRNK